MQHEQVGSGKYHIMETVLGQQAAGSSRRERETEA